MLLCTSFLDFLTVMFLRLTCNLCEHLLCLEMCFSQLPTKVFCMFVEFVYSTQSVYCRFITCCVIVGVVDQQWTSSFAELQKAKDIIRRSSYTENINCGPMPFCRIIHITLMCHFFPFQHVFVKLDLPVKCGCETRQQTPGTCSAAFSQSGWDLV